jgi:hypothetical protein
VTTDVTAAVPGGLHRRVPAADPRANNGAPRRRSLPTTTPHRPARW